ncbi:WbqC family protein [Saccharopolyspora mangrovi]|uniref:WbqC family protein n=1 Tax=Saccharopolyspora mangrovi TaxID=3082379 RepID=A0ABU6AJE9_9PSEU|nr:WbqC family protein [Saccharopolyspora sp. S2-29]MEB3371650.1 WbqC family protein [Saccharopolyspora sp. S2-29]
MTAVSIHQPNFLPWTKLMAKIALSDVHIVFDTAQYTRSEFHARQRIKNQAGGTSWLSVPVAHTGERQRLRDVRIDQRQQWKRRHLKHLTIHYGCTPHFDELYALVLEVYRRDHDHLVDHNLDLTTALCAYLGFDTPLVLASELDVPVPDNRQERLLELVRGVGGDAHLTSSGSTYQVDWSPFRRAGVPVLDQHFEHPVYAQPHGEFVPGLGVLDMLFVEGPSAAEKIRASSRFRLSEPTTVANPLRSVR